MNKYIDVDVLKEKIDSMWNGRPLSSLGARILVTIDEAPSIDIVRCKECVDFVYDEQYKCYGCATDNGLMGAKSSPMTSVAEENARRVSR